MYRILLAGVVLATTLIPAAAQQKYEADGVDLTRVEYEQFREPEIQLSFFVPTLQLFLPFFVEHTNKSSVCAESNAGG